MFRFGRKMVISHRAKELGNTLNGLVACLGSQTFDEFVEVMSRAKDKFQENYVDRGDGLSIDNKAYSFSEVGPHEGEFLFNAICPHEGRPHIRVEGHGRYFGLVISGSRVEEGIYIDLRDSVRALKRMGRDAKRMQTELLRFPGFKSMEDIRNSWAYSLGAADDHRQGI